MSQLEYLILTLVICEVIHLIIHLGKHLTQKDKNKRK